MRGLKSSYKSHSSIGFSRIPHGMRGLKCLSAVAMHFLDLASHPAWDAWIEIAMTRISFAEEESRIPHGMRGLK